MEQDQTASQFLAGDLARAAKNHFAPLFPARALDATLNPGGSVTVTKACALTGFISKEIHATMADARAAAAFSPDQEQKIIAGLKMFLDGAVHAASEALNAYLPHDEVVDLLTQLGLKVADEELLPPPAGPSQTPAP
jgi:hypothetical protein